MYIFAHRGASAHAPENTLLAVELAISQQADGIELDVFQHGDEFVVIHDHWLHRTTSGRGLLAETSFAELRALDAGQGQQVPTLREVMATIAGQCVLNIEMKGVDDIPALLAYVSQCQEAYHFQAEQLIYSSFNHHLLKQINHLAPSAKLGALTASNPVSYAEFAAQLGAYSVNIEVGFVDQAFVADAKARNLKVFVYTVDEPGDLIKLQSWGVDGVFSNSPQNARLILGL